MDQTFVYGAAVLSIHSAIACALAEQNLKFVEFPPALAISLLKPSSLRAEKLLASNFLEFHPEQVNSFLDDIQNKQLALTNLGSVLQDCTSSTTSVWKGKAADAARHTLSKTEKDVEAKAHIYEIASHNVSMGLKVTTQMIVFAQGQAWAAVATKRPIGIDHLLRGFGDALVAMGSDGVSSVVGTAMGKSKSAKYGLSFNPVGAIFGLVDGVRAGSGEFTKAVKDMQRSTQISSNVLDALCNLVENAENELDRIWSIVVSKTVSGEKISPTFTHKLKPIEVKGVEGGKSSQDKSIKCHPNPPKKELKPKTENQRREKKPPVTSTPVLTGGGAGGTSGSATSTFTRPEDIGRNYAPHPPISPAPKNVNGDPGRTPPYNSPQPDDAEQPYPRGDEAAVIEHIVHDGARTAARIHHDLWSTFIHDLEGSIQSTDSSEHYPPQQQSPSVVDNRENIVDVPVDNHPQHQENPLPDNKTTVGSRSVSNGNPSWSLRIEGGVGVEVSVENHHAATIEMSVDSTGDTNTHDGDSGSHHHDGSSTDSSGNDSDKHSTVGDHPGENKATDGNQNGDSSGNTDKDSTDKGSTDKDGTSKDDTSKDGADKTKTVKANCEASQHDPSNHVKSEHNSSEASQTAHATGKNEVSHAKGDTHTGKPSTPSSSGKGASSSKNSYTNVAVKDNIYAHAVVTDEPSVKSAPPKTPPSSDSHFKKTSSRHDDLSKAGMW